MKLLLITLLLAFGAADISLILDGKEVDINKQKTEGNIRTDGNNTRIKTKLSDIETEIGDDYIYAGGEIVQEYDINEDYDNENVTFSRDGNDLIIKVAGHEKQTDIEINFDRPDHNEDVFVDFDVDHEGEMYVIEIDDEGIKKERYRVDKSYVDVYVEEEDDGNAIDDDDVEIDIDVVIEDIDLDDENTVRFQIYLFGDADDEGDNVFVDAGYKHEVREKIPEDGQQDAPEEDEFEDLVIPVDCSKKVEFGIPSHRVASRGDMFEQFCSLDPTSIRPIILSVRWIKLSPTGAISEEVSGTDSLTILSPSCDDAAFYQCEMTYLCDTEVKVETSDPMSLIIDNGVVLNSICQIFGDPHIITFDKTLYSFQGECTYLLAMDAVYGRWIIYGRFTKCGDGTCLTSIMIYNQGVMIELQRGWIINLNGNKVTVKEGEHFSPVRGLSVYFDGYELFVELSRAQIQLIWDGLMNVKIEITNDAPTLGLCGNNNGDGTDDFMTFYGDIVEDSDEFGHLAAIDRQGICTKPVTLQHVHDTSEAKAVCEEVLMAATFVFVSDYIEEEATKRGDTKSLVRSEQFMEACIYDYMANMHVENLSAQCSAGYNYFSICRRFGLCIPEGWQRSVGCMDKAALQDLTITQGCPYGDTPLPFNRDNDS